MVIQCVEVDIYHTDELDQRDLFDPPRRAHWQAIGGTYECTNFVCTGSHFFFEIYRCEGEG